MNFSWLSISSDWKKKEREKETERETEKKQHTLIQIKGFRTNNYIYFIHHGRSDSEGKTTHGGRADQGLHRNIPMADSSGQIMYSCLKIMWQKQRCASELVIAASGTDRTSYRRQGLESDWGQWWKSKERINRSYLTGGVRTYVVAFVNLSTLIETLSSGAPNWGSTI